MDQLMAFMRGQQESLLAEACDWRDRAYLSTELGDWYYAMAQTNLWTRYQAQAHAVHSTEQCAKRLAVVQ